MKRDPSPLIYGCMKSIARHLQMTVAAMIASLNPSIIHRQNTGTDSEELQQLQHDLLLFVHQKYPEAMYPAATCTLADLIEVTFAIS